MKINVYYMFILCVSLLSFIDIKLAGRLTLIVIPIILSGFISTGFDYDYYRLDYQSSYFSFKPPFFYTSSELTAEPLYKIYSSAVRVITGFGFPLFLGVNFILCMLLYFSFSPLRKTNASSLNYVVLLYSLPVILPTLFYFSPRSSISFFLVLSGLFLLYKNKHFLALIISFLGIMIHSQYIPFVCFLFVVFLCVRKDIHFKSADAYKKLAVLGVLFLVFLKFIPIFIGVIGNVLSFLPSADLAMSKLHYLDSAERGIRVTSILSLVIYPVLCVSLYFNRVHLSNKFLLDEYKVWCLIFFISLCTVYGFVINLVYFDTPHLSGRLGRFSDYFLFMFLLPISLVSRFSIKVVVFVLFLFVAMAPFLYPTVYSIHGEMF